MLWKWCAHRFHEIAFDRAGEIHTPSLQGLRDAYAESAQIQSFKVVAPVFALAPLGIDSTNKCYDRMVFWPAEVGG